MRINSSIVAILGLLLLGTAVTSAADAPKGFRDLTWGTSPGKQMKSIPAPIGTDMAMYKPSQGRAMPPLFQVPVADEEYSFSKGRFFSASAWIDGKANFAKIEAALIKRYGQPSVTDERKKIRIWKWPDSPVEVRLGYDEKYSRATVTYVNPDLTAPK
jgi:hypothetical protein